MLTKGKYVRRVITETLFPNLGGIEGRKPVYLSIRVYANIGTSGQDME